jgi:hypothetical protein
VASIPSRRTGLAGQLWDLDNTALLGRLPHSLTTGRGVSGHLGPDPLDDPVCFSLTDLNEFVLQIAALGGHQQRGTLPYEIMAERLISPTAGFEVNSLENASWLLATAQVVHNRVIRNFIWHLRASPGSQEYR